MPKDTDIKKVLVIGSGPIIIGQAAEFDYAGTQACRALREEGVEVVLVNSNPATIMTDPEIADHVYIEPLQARVIERIIEKEKPDSLLPTLGGQTGLNLAMELSESGFLAKQGVRLLGTAAESIYKAEDREAFKETMEAIGEPIIESIIANDVAAALTFASEVGYPLIVRPAYTLGGTGGGIADDEEALKRITADGIRASRVGQVLIEKSVAGYKEIEYEVMRDKKGNCITVCNMENIDPVGIHTGDSIVVAPSQTLRDAEYQMLRSASLNIINALEIEGGCNVQLALDTDSMQYYVIEVNPRVSRSSALASKATGYPIAKVATRIALGYGLDEIVNDVTGKTYACFEPTLDYVVAKIPKWPFDKFVSADKSLGTRMKATGEVMSIGSTVEEALLKAVRSLEIGLYSMEVPGYADIPDKEITRRLGEQTDERLFVVAEALRRGMDAGSIHDITTIDRFFLDKIERIVRMEETFKFLSIDTLGAALLKKAKKMGFADKAIAKWLGAGEDEVRRFRVKNNIKPVYKLVDTCAAEFDAVSPYYYSTYQQENEAIPSDNKKIVVLGSGPIRIGQGIEFDYCSVHCVWALQQMGYETIIVNNNPETVSTDFDISDRLYFEPLTDEDVLNILELESPAGVVVQFGGQTAIKLAHAVSSAGYAIVGTAEEDINRAEDRKEFEALLEALDIARPKAETVFTQEEAVEAANRLGYPILVRPSYVLGGQGMEIAYTDADIEAYMSIINRSEQEHPVLVDKYLIGREIEVDAICDGVDILIPGIMEHVERAGVHSGDSMSVYPPQNIGKKILDKIVSYTEKLALGLRVSGMINIQYIEHRGELYVIEVNPRSSRTVPYISKVTGVPMIELATRCAMGQSLRDMGYGIGLYPEKEIVAVKVPVFSFEKLPEVEVSLGPEMKSTGEVLGVSPVYREALYKGMTGAGYQFAKKEKVLITVAGPDKPEAVEVASALEDLGYEIWATPGTARFLRKYQITAQLVHKLHEGEPDMEGMIKSGEVSLIVNTPTKGRDPLRDGFRIRRLAVENGVPCITSMDTAAAFVSSLRAGKNGDTLILHPLEEIG